VRKPLPICFISGPFSAPTEWERRNNTWKAQLVGLQVAKLGAWPHVPHANTGAFYGEVSEAQALAGCLELLRRSDALVLVEGWERSAGAKAEAEEAARRMIPVFEWASEGDRSEFATWARTWAPPAPRVGERGNAASRAGSVRLGGIGEGEVGRLRSLLSDATPLPWEAVREKLDRSPAGVEYFGDKPNCDEWQTHIRQAFPGMYGLHYPVAAVWSSPFYEPNNFLCIKEADAELLVGAVNALPGLLDRVAGASILATSHAATLRHLQAVEEEHGAALRRVGELEAWGHAALSKLREVEKALQEIHRQASGVVHSTHTTRQIRDLAAVALGAAGEASPSPSAPSCPGSGAPKGIRESDPYRAAVQKRDQLDREIGQVEDERLRSNLRHTLSKLWMFLSTAIEETGGAS
jgi:hypothetical protein